MKNPEFQPVEGMRNWNCAVVDGDVQDLVQLARQLNRTRRKGEYHVCGFLKREGDYELRHLSSTPNQEGFLIDWKHGHRLFRIETNDPIEIIRAFDVGRQGEASYGSDPEKVWEELALIHARNPIVPYFADDASLEFEFEQPISEEFGTFLNEALTDGLEEYGAHEMEGNLADWVKRDGFLRLWWD